MDNENNVGDMQGDGNRKAYLAEYYRRNKDKIVEQRKIHAEATRPATMRRYSIDKNNPSTVKYGSGSEYRKNQSMNYRKREGERVNAKNKERYTTDENYKAKRKEIASKYNVKRMSITPVSSKKESLERLAEVRRATEKEIFTSLEVRYILGIGHNEYYRLVKNNVLIATKENRAYQIKLSDLISFMDIKDT